ncbi:MAG: chitobiase/beta-hexosaminidase C-terminal domain-containing protein [Candidatus Sungbacteria bacterium]|uniref:Chitobiase/beta-hexosaminidase C-terminal domain-containing protein n=1 Tax=Candidatus Sungiibacteriota bacterium TaxID=2750080 RepID=A0A932R0I7_9BACT|nr:chitobiase/beta-hexosaminidase C-terminal domain-containing protein [Candidatus Sungbacteria bacterium]
MNQITKKIYAMSALLALFATSVFASEVTGNLSNGLTNGVQGVVIVSPSAQPAAGTFTSSQSVVLSAAGSTSIHYTVDGATPTCTAGQTYGAAVVVWASQTLKTISCYPDSQSSSVASFVYVINLTVTPSNLSLLLTSNALDVPTGQSTTSTPSLQATQDIAIQVTAGGGMSTVTVPSGTVITTTSGASFDATALAASEPSSGTLSNLGSGVVVDGSLQWGIPNLGLQFSTPITLRVFVGTSLNGQTLTVMRSVTGTSGWTSDGIVSPATCVVAAGVCTFSATKASYYTATHTTPITITTATASSNGGGGGGIFFPSGPSKLGDMNKDGKTDILDFNFLMVNWGTRATGGAAQGDLNNDGNVDVLDFNILMVNWTL